MKDIMHYKGLSNAAVLIPIKHVWEPLFHSLHKFSDDFMESRNQPQQQKREDIF